MINLIFFLLIGGVLALESLSSANAATETLFFQEGGVKQPFEVRIISAEEYLLFLKNLALGEGSFFVFPGEEKESVPFLSFSEMQRYTAWFAAKNNRVEPTLLVKTRSGVTLPNIDFDLKSGSLTWVLCQEQVASEELSFKKEIISLAMFLTGVSLTALWIQRSCIDPCYEIGRNRYMLREMEGEEEVLPEPRERELFPRRNHQEQTRSLPREIRFENLMIRGRSENRSYFNGTYSYQRSFLEERIENIPPRILQNSPNSSHEEIPGAYSLETPLRSNLGRSLENTSSVEADLYYPGASQEVPISNQAFVPTALFHSNIALPITVAQQKRSLKKSAWRSLKKGIYYPLKKGLPFAEAVLSETAVPESETQESI